jgi:16S rRNA (cytosine967-C5)-methyltransferase
VNAREIAFKLLMAWSQGRRTADELLEERNPAERALVQELFYGCIRQKLALEHLIRQFAGKPPRRAVRTILEIGLYQLAFMRVPAHAAVHETVDLAKKHASPAEAKFVNAVLRRCAENNATYVALISALRETQPWAGYSHPRWLFERWERRWGRAATVALCEWNNQPPPVYARGDRPWPGVLEPTAFHPLCYRVIDTQKFFANPGRYYVQDPSTLIAVDVLDPQPGESVLDLCAAPGGKTTYIAQKMQDRGRIIAADSSNGRLGLVTENCRRLGVNIVATLACEGTRLQRCLRGSRFDRVLLDAPCSNTGVLRRRVDLRWRIREDEIGRLAALQSKLLDVAGQLTQPGGVLVYSTCSLEPEENEQVVEQFRARHKEFTLEQTRASMPPRDQIDGAFVARLRRR